MVDNPEAFATTVTTRLAIDALRSVRSRREHYVGSWLPEPLIEEDARQAAGAVAPVSRPGTGHGLDPARQVEMDETLSTAVLVLMEELAPVERAVFVLREVLGYEYRQIAEAVDKSEANCRQLYARAKRRIDSGRPDFDTDRVVREKVVREFVTALREADLARLEALLVEDVVFMGDGGGKAPAIRIPAVGALRVARFILGLVGQAQRASVDIVETTANGSPAFLLRADRAVVGVLTLEISGGRIAALRNQINPDKLSHLNRDFEERPGPSHA